MDQEITSLLDHIISDEHLHACWLNTLSYLENCGARKIAACEHPTAVKEEVLKHAAEEFRHAHHLKRQIAKVTDRSYETYAKSLLLGGSKALHYLNALDLWLSRFLKMECGYSRADVKKLAYLLVTYAIEKRAEVLYPLYHSQLRVQGSKVTVKAIILEEKEHLEEMERGLRELPRGFEYAKKICQKEELLYQNFITTLSEEIGF